MRGEGIGYKRDFEFGVYMWMREGRAQLANNLKLIRLRQRVTPTDRKVYRGLLIHFQNETSTYQYLFWFLWHDKNQLHQEAAQDKD